MPLAKDLLHPDPEEEKRKCKLKRLVPHPKSYFMDIKCKGCFKITTVFSHAQTVVTCSGCNTVLCRPKGGKCHLTKSFAIRKRLTDAQIKAIQKMDETSASLDDLKAESVSEMIN
ncbi:40S ribosomal protein S27 [Trichinella pseudospiralis]|uniref:40S ribosomal protein S27 n=1 Tax=Trichinella pseudospiralis TaxID=6337 RepID=A0A0V0Y1N8_TRIPS|nr:40S ribosomal protein S27 [Trichinella pseudospiralis]KRY69766.1 40S ribosomal protein S27 [Trichinella pseudospiralis]KRZ41978.1 40S ribosomal protein S27 [Trichinella pseudospiralis]